MCLNYQNRPYTCWDIVYCIWGYQSKSWKINIQRSTLKLKCTNKNFCVQFRKRVHSPVSKHICPLDTFMLQCIYHQEFEQDTSPLQHLKQQNIYQFWVLNQVSLGRELTPLTTTPPRTVDSATSNHPSVSWLII